MKFTSIIPKTTFVAVSYLSYIQFGFLSHVSKYHVPQEDHLLDIPLVDIMSSTKEERTSRNNEYDSSDNDNEDEEFFSACLLTMDDNHLLPEWLAYHYTFLPLKRLIVAVDPKSTTSPQDIFDRFRPYINITLWSDEDYYYKPRPDFTSVQNHRARQKRFIRGCLRRLKLNNDNNNNSNKKKKKQLHQQRREPTWVAFVDTDEYVAPNLQSTTVDGYQMIENYNRNMTALDIMKNNPHMFDDYNSSSPACLPKNRFRVTIKESSSNQVFKDVTDGIDAKSLMTLRYRYSMSGATNESQFAKSFIDLSRLNISEIRPDNHIVHRPVRSVCSKDTIKGTKFEHSPFVTYHYAGTLEAFMVRQDDARNKRTTDRYYEWFGDPMNVSHEDDGTRFWITRFVDKVGGIEKAKELLVGAGNVTLGHHHHHHNRPTNKAAVHEDAGKDDETTYVSNTTTKLSPFVEAQFEKIFDQWNRLKEMPATGADQQQLAKPHEIYYAIPRNRTKYNIVDSEYSITVATHASSSKLIRLLFQIQRWGGPASAAIYISTWNDIQIFKDFYTKYASSLQFTDFHILIDYLQQQQKQLHNATKKLLYPHNLLREMAFQAINDTDYFLALDADFVTNPPNTYPLLQQQLQSDPQLVYQLKHNKTLMVLPAFNRVANKNVNDTNILKVGKRLLPSSKEEAITMKQKKQLNPFQIVKAPAGHRATQFGKWFEEDHHGGINNSSSFYGIDFEAKFEPYVLAYKGRNNTNPSLPSFWPGFRGYGFNKWSWFVELYYMGYNFGVLRDYFVIHFPHPTKYKKSFPIENIYQLSLFQKYMKAKYNLTEEEADTFAPPANALTRLKAYIAANFTESG